MVAVKKGKEFKYDKPTDLKGKTVGVYRGVSYGDVFDKAVSQGIFKLYEFRQVARALEMLSKGRIDAILIGPGKYGLEQVVKSDPTLSESDFSLLPIPFKRDAKHLGFAKLMNMKSFLEKFNSILKKGHQNGTFDKIIEGYLR